MDNNICPICGGDSTRELRRIKILMILIGILSITLLIGVYLLENVV